MEVVASLSQGRTAATQCGLFTHKSVPVIFEPPCILNVHRSDGFSILIGLSSSRRRLVRSCRMTPKNALKRKAIDRTVATCTVNF